MSGFNLPPGITVNDIPGNEPSRQHIYDGSLCWCGEREKPDSKHKTKKAKRHLNLKQFRIEYSTTINPNKNT